MKRNNKPASSISKPSFFMFPFPLVELPNGKFIGEPCAVEVACYYGGKNLHVSAFKGNGFEDLTDIKAWDFFYNRASFESIIASMEGITKSEISTKQYNKNMCDIAFLHMIRDNPHRLFDSTVLNRFVAYFQVARYSTDKKKYDEYIFNLHKEFIPVHVGGRRQLLPSIINYDLAIELLKKLAKHLSEECKTALKKGDYDVEDAIADDNWDDTYDFLRRWAKDNDYRIYDPSKEELKTLILKPSTTFLDKLLSKSLFTSEKTFKRA